MIARLTATNLELFEPLAKAILKHWNPNIFDENILQVPTSQQIYLSCDYVYSEAVIFSTPKAKVFGLSEFKYLLDGILQTHKNFAKKEALARHYQNAPRNPDYNYEY